MYKIFIAIGILFILAGSFIYFFKDFPFFRLPGDIIIKKENFTFYFPITSGIILSVIFTVIFYFVGKR